MTLNSAYYYYCEVLRIHLNEIFRKFYDLLAKFNYIVLNKKSDQLISHACTNLRYNCLLNQSVPWTECWQLPHLLYR